MKNLLISIFLIFISYTYSQNISKSDSTNIIFKSKLFTLSEYGIGTKHKIIEDVDSQKAVFLETLYDKFLFIKVDFSQPYRNLNGSINTLNRYCSYYLAFNIVDSKFYRIGGFRINDINDFFEDLEQRETSIFKGVSGNEIEEIDIHCLYDYLKLSKRKKDKRGFSCFKKCKKYNENKIIINQ